jgi:acyl-CoA synthetase (AMP-forming)/AMP-acid ligase II
MATSLMHRGLESAAERFPDHPAVLAGDDCWTYGELDRAANALAQHLAARGIGRGERVAVMTSNRPEFVVTVHAASKVGAAPVMLNSSWKSLEVDTALGLTGPRYGVADGPGVGLLTEHLGADGVLDLDAPLAATVIDRTSRVAPPAVAVQPTDDAAFVFSSGTTDRPKAVRHTHRSIDLGTAHWVAGLGLTEADRFQVATPPSHILGLLNLLAAAAAGATVRLHRRFDLDEELRCIQDDRMTLEMAVAPIALAMANHPDLESYDLSSLRYIMWGATPITPSVAARVTARTGVRWLPAYGTSEVPVIAANPVADPDRWRLDSAGLPVDGVTLRVVDLESGKVLGPGGVGEVQVHSASAMAGYLPDEATAAAFADGWYRTGDVGWLEPEGWVHLTDRCKEMIKVSGFQVAPAEIEAVLHGHPAVVDCAVFGVPDARAGEVPVAAVQLQPGSKVTAAELEALVADTLATYKRVHRVIMVEVVPRTPSGKVLRRTLRDEWAPTFAAAPD